MTHEEHKLRCEVNRALGVLSYYNKSYEVAAKMAIEILENALKGNKL